MIQVGKIAQEQLNRRGWLVGQFFEGEFKSTEVEIYCKKCKKGWDEDKLHMHPVGVEYLFVLEGRIKMRIGEEVLELSTGDYVKIPAKICDQVLEVFEDSVIFGVRMPSIPNNKIFLD